MARRHNINPANLKPNPHCPREREINILLLGQTGVGKTTFINALANYFVYNTLEEAVHNEMQVIIPSMFHHADPNTFDEIEIRIGKEDECENANGEGESNTQKCRSFIFPIGDRNLRLIDTPGIGDTRGLEQDAKNFQEILTFIAQYEHLNGVLILFKPNEERVTILFRFAINELLRHLAVSAKDNIIFIFTNSRSTFFMPAGTKKILDVLLEKHRKEQNVDVPFTKQNTFLFDNEPFRYLALRKNGIQLDKDQTLSYENSWEHSVKEYARLMTHIITRPLHAVSHTLSLNEAEQLIRRLPRPIAEIARLIEENIQLAKDFKKKVLENPDVVQEGIPQVNVSVVEEQHPQTVCASKKCCRVTGKGDDKQIEYLSICHDKCYLNGVVQERLNDEELANCEVMDINSGECSKCKCHWSEHKHPTYKMNRDRSYFKPSTTASTSKNGTMSLKDIDKRISDLREENRQIQDVYKKIARFLHANALLPINDEYVEYLRYFINEEQMKHNAGGRNAETIANLQKMMHEYEIDMDLFRKSLKNDDEVEKARSELQPENIFTLVGTLYHLPINGKQIRDQVQGIQFNEEKYSGKGEQMVELPARAATSKIMGEVRNIVS